MSCKFLSLIHICAENVSYRGCIACIWSDLVFLDGEAILYMSVPDVMGEGRNLNILSITVHNLHKVRVGFIAVKYYEFIGHYFRSYDFWFQILPKFLPLFEGLISNPS